MKKTIEIYASVNFGFIPQLEDMQPILEFIAEQFHQMDSDYGNWYSPGWTLEEALSKITLKDNQLVDEGVKYISENFPHVVSIWDGNSNDGSSIKIMDIDNKKTLIRLVLSQESDLITQAKVVTLMTTLINKWTTNYVTVGLIHDGITAGDKVFPNRPEAGWMIYLPHIITPAELPIASALLPVIKETSQIGTIIVSTDDLFDSTSKEDYIKSNEIEIALVDLGLLPLYSEL